MIEPIRDDQPLNLDSRSFEEQGRIPDCRGMPIEPTLLEIRPDLLGPHVNRRCETAQRELLRNAIPPDFC